MNKIFKMTTMASLFLLNNLLCAELLEGPAVKFNVVPSVVEIDNRMAADSRIDVIALFSLPNSCYKAGDSAVDISASQGKIVIHNYAFLLNRRICLQVIQPYWKIIPLENVPAGDYDVIFVDDEGRSHPKAIVSVPEK